MTRRLADPHPSEADRPFWASAGWIIRRRASSSGSRGAGEGGEGGSSGATDDDDDDDDDDDEEENEENEENEERGEGKGKDDNSAKERMKAADRAKRKAELEAEDLRKELQKIQDKDKTALELAESKVQKLQEENEGLIRENGRLKMEGAFASVGEHEWLKPGAALRLAQSEGYLDEVLKEDGSVNQKVFRKKVAEFAKAFPELLKPKGEKQDGLPPSGVGVGSGGRPRVAKDDETIRKKYGNLLR